MFIIALGIGILGFFMIFVGKTSDQSFLEILGTIMTTIAGILFLVNAFV